MLGFDPSLPCEDVHIIMCNNNEFKDKAICSQRLPLLSLQVFHQGLACWYINARSQSGAALNALSPFCYWERRGYYWGRVMVRKGES